MSGQYIITEIFIKSLTPQQLIDIHADDVSYPVSSLKESFCDL
ncbi:MAG: hypothetical protein J07HQW2_02321 [Haloquadratum walsbyi J07HQW2]|uniref:Uncharacterized protein n=1 Tax=Haloquadratum walsbyi J07HQW2 TaxID=1238425 RepID=U1PU32_9EURY|nr:MAG: hypothetical protein J07HQW2_02321 [Haloquadratum walsbyi J07HQW2]